MFPEEREEQERDYRDPRGWPDGKSAPPDYVPPLTGADSRDYAVCIERTISDGVEILIYQRRSD